MDAVLAPPGVVWQAVSPRLRTARRVIVLVVVGLPGLGLAAVLAATVGGRVPLAVLAVAAVLVGLLWRAVGRNYAAWGYAERADDLLIRHGVLVRRLSVVPYGRMQFLDVTAAPVDRWLGIATLRLHTAAAGTDALIPGLPAAEAARLRDRLAALGEARAAGL